MDRIPLCDHKIKIKQYYLFFSIIGEMTIGSFLHFNILTISSKFKMNSFLQWSYTLEKPNTGSLFKFFLAVVLHSGKTQHWLTVQILSCSGPTLWKNPTLAHCSNSFLQWSYTLEKPNTGSLFKFFLAVVLHSGKTQHWLTVQHCMVKRWNTACRGLWEWSGDLCSCD